MVGRKDRSQIGRDRSADPPNHRRRARGALLEKHDVGRVLGEFGETLIERPTPAVPGDETKRGHRDRE